MAAAAVQAPPQAAEAEAPSLAYRQVPETQYDLEWAQLATLDLSTFDQPGGKAALAKQLEAALQTIGFFYVVRFGLSQDEVDRQFAIGQAVFALPTDEKLRYRADLENGGYNGYKPLGLLYPAHAARPHPSIVRDHQPEIERFARHIHDHIVGELLVLFAIILELPEDALTSCHRYNQLSDYHLRYMKYHRCSAADNAKLENVWVRGHTDVGSLTLLFRQPVAALQVRGADGGGRWVQPLAGSITVHVADALPFLTHGFLQSSIHRVVAPPPDQAHIDRLGVLYFVRPADALALRPVQSAVLARWGCDANEDGAAVGGTAGEWVKARVKGHIGQDGKRLPLRGLEQEVIQGQSARYYN